MSATDRIVMVGFGNIGQAVVPLLHAHFPGYRVIAFDQHDDAIRIARAAAMGVELIHYRIDAHNFSQLIAPYLRAGDFLLNLAPAVSSCALLALAQSCDAFYLDTGIEPWAYALSNEARDATSNHALREEMLALQRTRPGMQTALVAHGANPGFVSLLVKRALLELARVLEPSLAVQHRVPRTRQQWAAFAQALDVRVIQISECDTQRADTPRLADEFVNTWSVEGFATECLQPVELGWGTHEATLPVGARRWIDGSQAAIQLAQRGHEMAVQTWTPLRGPLTACILTHNESISIAEYFTVPAHGDRAGRDGAAWRPTVYYAYRPCAAAVASLALLDDTRNAEDGAVVGDWRERVMKEELVAGEDELGVLVMSGRGQSVWLGSALSIERARALAPYNNATSLQVVSSIVAGMQWMREHPREGIVESDAIDDEAAFECARPYWEPMQCVTTAWRPEPESPALSFAEFLLTGRTLATLDATDACEPALAHAA
jgi:homospermidine synthase